MPNKTSLVWTDDDFGLFPPGQLPYKDLPEDEATYVNRMVEFLDKLGIPGSLAVVPVRINKETGQPAFLYDNKHLCAALRDARSAGLDVFQHGTTHTFQESGVLDYRFYGTFLKMQYAAKASRERLYHERYWSVDAIRAQMEWGRNVFTEALGETPTGYRMASYCTNTYKALSELGYKWSSNQLVSISALVRSFNDGDESLVIEGPGKPFRVEGIVEIPMIDDFAFHVEEKEISTATDAGWKLWTECRNRGYPFVPVSHWTSLEHGERVGYRIHETVIQKILDTGQAEPMTLSQYYERLCADEFEIAPKEEYMPANPPPWHVWAFEPK